MNAPVWTIRTVSALEALRRTDELLDLYGEAFAGPPWSQSTESVVAHLPRLEQQLDHPRTEILVAERAGRLDGAAFGWTTDPGEPDDDLARRVRPVMGPAAELFLSPDAFVLVELMVRPAGQGSGLGGALMESLVAGRPVWLLTHPDGAATRFYDRRGCRTIGELRTCDGVPLVVYVRDR